MHLSSNEDIVLHSTIIDSQTLPLGIGWDTFLLDPWEREKANNLSYSGGYQVPQRGRDTIDNHSEVNGHMIGIVRTRPWDEIDKMLAKRILVYNNDQIQQRWLVGKLTDLYNGDHERSKYGEPLGFKYLLSLSPSIFLLSFFAAQI